MSATRDRSIGRRDFLTRFFRVPNRVAPSVGVGNRDDSSDRFRGSEDTSQTRDAHHQISWRDGARAGRDLTAPECAPESLTGESNMERVLRAINDWTGIEDL